MKEKKKTDSNEGDECYIRRKTEEREESHETDADHPQNPYDNKQDRAMLILGWSSHLCFPVASSGIIMNSVRFKVNLYDPCLANQMIVGSQQKWSAAMYKVWRHSVMDYSPFYGIEWIDCARLTKVSQDNVFPRRNQKQYVIIRIVNPHRIYSRSTLLQPYESHFNVKQECYFLGFNQTKTQLKVVVNRGKTHRHWRWHLEALWSKRWRCHLEDLAMHWNSVVSLEIYQCLPRQH